MVGNVTRNAHHLFLLVQQAQTQPLLCVLHIAPHDFLFTFQFFEFQIPKHTGDRSHEQHHGSQRRDERVAVLAAGRLHTPPLTPTVDQGMKQRGRAAFVHGSRIMVGL